jgi:hypothetical protein
MHILVENPHLATFKVLEDAHKMIWVSRHVQKTFPGADDLGGDHSEE